MADRIQGLTVTLDRDYRHDDALEIIKAIMMIKGVVGVKSHVTELSDYIARSRVSFEIQGELTDALNDIFQDRKYGP